MKKLSKTQILRLFHALNEELAHDKVVGELYLVGGAVMCLVFGVRASTVDVDAIFQPTTKLRKAAHRVANRLNVDEHWLNDGVKGFASSKGDFANYLELSHLHVLTATPNYMLAMKCLATRIGEEFHDVEDIRYLLRHLGIETFRQACEVIELYYPVEQLPPKAHYVLQEILSAAR